MTTKQAALDVYVATVDRLKRRYISPAGTICTHEAGKPTRYTRLCDAAWRRCKAQQAAPRIMEALERLAHPMADDSDLDHACSVIRQINRPAL